MLKKEFERGGPLQHLLLRYTQALIAHVTQTAGLGRRGEPGFRRTCLRTFEPANARRDAARRAGVGDQG
jgi:hypothetical protein